MALSGIKSVIPLNEVITAMKNVSRDLPSSLKETSQGGVADTKTAKEIERNIDFKNENISGNTLMDRGI